MGSLKALSIKALRLPKGGEKSRGHITNVTLGSRSTEPFETLCAYGLVYHELDGCATRESRETQGEFQQDPHALPGAERAYGLVLRRTSHQGATDDRQ